ncbi:hypothetical protein E5676_scaffold1280G00090 [Cucumis melo var. makuwa]|uniref:DUF4283 domain-containing protein n=1 Tax=Cucumis melo var. makuwa TaxID=1194695 RepID=A0A5A7U128_CUCMM|nr:hypothetical protein E6C27_scaffold83G00690 [Cucumis melo var. makuwa]TYK29739.1 hypothetical protein E5676_scaffold1280G00090 [Cucumis melo var. makuwa]
MAFEGGLRIIKRARGQVLSKAGSRVALADTKVAEISPCPSSNLNTDKQKQWVIRNSEVISTNFENLWIITKLFAFDDRRKIRKMLENYFQAKIVINPLFDENALINLDEGSIKDLICNEGKWQVLGSFYLKFEKWDKHKYSRPLTMKGYGGWLKIKNLLWITGAGEPSSEARIQVKHNLCGFVPSTIEIIDPKRGNIFLNFGDFEFLNPPFPTSDTIMVSDFKKSIHLLRIMEVLQDEGSDLSFFPRFECPEINFRTSSHSSKSICDSGTPSGSLISAREDERSKKSGGNCLNCTGIRKVIFIGFCKSMNNCLFDFGGHAKSDFPFQKQVVEGPERERESRKAPLINIFPSIPPASENTTVAGSQAEDELFEWATEQSPPAPEKTIVASRGHFSPSNPFKCAKDSKYSHVPRILKSLSASKPPSTITIPSSTVFLPITWIFWKCTAPKFRYLNASIGSPCKGDISVKNQLEISSPISVSSEDSAETTSEVDLKLDSGIEVMDLNVLFNDESFPPNRIPLDLPKDLLSLVNDFGIILA